MNNELSQEAKELALYKNQLDIIRNVSEELLKVDNLKFRLRKILNILDEEFEIKHCMILLPDASYKYLSVFASHGYPETTINVPFGKGIAGMVAERKIALNLTGLRHKKRYLDTISHKDDDVQETLPGLPDAQSQIALPLLSGNELVAVLLAESKKVSVFSAENEKFLKTLSPQIAISIQNSILFDTMEEKIRNRTQELENSNQTKDKLFSIISHDLRGPVTSFQSITQLLKHYVNKGESNKIESLHDKIDLSVTRLNFLLDNLLNWSSKQGNNIYCHFEPIQLSSFFKEVTDLYSDNLTSKDIRLELSIAPDDFVFADYNTLSVIFRNLLSNALKFTPRNGSIAINVTRNENFVNISVTDTGNGMDEEQLKALFMLSGMKSTIGTEKERGTGLGLVLVQEFVTLNKGTIHVASTPCRGAIFTVTLPSVSA